ncbi:MAG: restriction endonuclease subunit S [Geobacter sp.]|nr:restriction endonuclease subunit S [Geobacter sp.]
MNNTVPPGYKQTEVGVIPEEWEVDCIGNAFEICNQFRLPISQAVRERMNGPYPYYGPTNVQGYINEYRIEGEYALIGEDGDHFLKWRDQSMTLLVKGKFNVNNHAHIIRGTKNLTEWFYWYFAHSDITPHLSRQGAGRFKLNKKTLIQIPCALPPLPEQRAIATALSDLDALIASLDRLIIKKRDMKQAAMQELLTGKRRLPGFSGEWEVKRLGEICFFENGDRGTNYPSPASFVHSGIPFVNAGHVANGRINRSNMDYITKDSYDRLGSGKFKNGDILFCLRGSLGKFGIVDADFGIGAVASSLIIVRNKPTSLCVGYLSTFFNSWLCEQMIEKWSGGAAQPNLGGQDLAKFEILLPSLPEQTAIATILSDMDTEIAALEQKRDKTRLLKQGMMQELLTGRIRLI